MFHKIKLLIQVIIRSYFTIKKVGIPKFNDKNSEYIIWVPYLFSKDFFANDNFQKTFAAYHFLKLSGRSVTIFFNKNIGEFYNKKIIFYGSSKYNYFGFRNYMEVIPFISKNLEEQGNIVFPSSYEASLWENKSEMHSVFENLNIRTPKTLKIDLERIVHEEIESFQYPALIKEEHSCSSRGIYKVDTPDDVYNLLKNKLLVANNKHIILQQLLEMRKDLRVILVKNNIVLHYWRVNLSEDWKPTSTGHGSKVDFETFPEQWKDWIIETFKKLNITTGAFDIAWQNDDLDSEPYILEVSPFYQPNPKPKTLENINNYGKWKKSLTYKDNYQKAVVDVIFNIQEKFIESINSKNESV